MNQITSARSQPTLLVMQATITDTLASGRYRQSRYQLSYLLPSAARCSKRCRHETSAGALPVGLALTLGYDAMSAI